MLKENTMPFIKVSIPLLGRSSKQSSLECHFCDATNGLNSASKLLFNNLEDDSISRRKGSSGQQC